MAKATWAESFKRKEPIDLTLALILERKTAKDLTTEQLGKVIGIQQQQMSRLLHRHTWEWKYSYKAKLLDYLGVPMELQKYAAALDAQELAKAK